MDDRDDLYNLIIEEFNKTGSVNQVAKNLGSNTIKVRRVLITEGLWESESSRQVGALFAQGKNVKEIAKELCMSEKNVQSYMPYTRGAYGGSKSNDAERSDAYRERIKNAAMNQAAVGEAKTQGVSDIKGTGNKPSKIVSFPKKKTTDSRKNPISTFERQPSVLKLRFELVAPYYTGADDLDMEPEEKAEFLKNAKAEKGIIRDVLVHGEMNLHAVHYMIQRLFGWQNSHLHRFALSQDDFDAVTNGQRVNEYLDLCGLLFKFPGAEMNDQFWDDDFMGGISIKSWLRSKYTYGFRNYAVEESLIKNHEYVRQFREEHGKDFVNPRTTLEDLADKRIYFKNPYNTLLEGLSVRDLFRSAYGDAYNVSAASWRSIQDMCTTESIEAIEKKQKQDPKGYQNLLDCLQGLMDLRNNVLNIDKAIRYGQGEDVRNFFHMDPVDAWHEQKQLVKEYEDRLEIFLNSFAAIPFTDTVYYNYDFGDDWCVKITCLEAYTANDNYDVSYNRSLPVIDGVVAMPKRIPVQNLQYIDKGGNPVDEQLREKLQTVYTKSWPICAMADGLNVFDDAGGLYQFQEFLRTINSKKSEDAEEKEDALAWAKSLGWTGRKTKPENIL